MRALVFIGDCFEEDEADVLRFAGQLAIRAATGFRLSGRRRPNRDEDLQVDRAFDPRRARAVRLISPEQLRRLLGADRAVRGRRSIRAGRVRTPHRQYRGARAAESARKRHDPVALAGLVAVFVLAVLLRSLWIRSGLNVRQTLLTIGVAALVIVIVGLTVTGRLNWIVAALAATVPLVRRIGTLRAIRALARDAVSQIPVGVQGRRIHRPRRTTTPGARPPRAASSG